MMKAEKIEKHRERRTVVVAKNGYNSDWDVVGVIKRESMAGAWVVGLSNSKADHWSHDSANIRKATDDERAEFFEWIYNDGRDVADGFQRFGGVPRGFEEWRAAQTPATPDIAPPFTVGQRVRITDRAPLLEKRYVGKVGPVTQVSGPPPSAIEGQPVCVAFADLPPCWFHAYCLEPVADEPMPEPVVTPQRKVGDLRVWLDGDGFATVGRVRLVDDDGDVWIERRYNKPDAVFEPTPENVARLVEQQRARGVEPELGDLVFVLINSSVTATALVAHNVSTEPDAKLLQGVMCGGGAFSWGLAPDLAARTLVIRRSPFRPVEAP